MKRSQTLAGIGILLLAYATTSWSKGPIIRIVIEGDYLAGAIEITDPEILNEFSIWNGPSAGMRHPVSERDLSAYAEPDGSARRFIDWPKGFAADRPGELQRVQVTFYVGAPLDPANAREFVFAYELDSKNGRGFIYLPYWKNDLISYGVELNWLYAHRRWNELIMPLIAERSADSVGRSQLECKVGEGSIDPGGTIEFVLIDKFGKKTSRWRYEPSTKGYQYVRAHIGDVEPDQPIVISCWPPRS
jgi:hypothetical protein